MNSLSWLSLSCNYNQLPYKEARITTASLGYDHNDQYMKHHYLLSLIVTCFTLLVSRTLREIRKMPAVYQDPKIFQLDKSVFSNLSQKKQVPQLQCSHYQLYSQCERGNTSSVGNCIWQGASVSIMYFESEPTYVVPSNTTGPFDAK